MSDFVRDAIASLTGDLEQLAVTPASASGYGVDLVCVDDIDPNLAETDPNGTLGLAQDVYHRVTTTRGTLPDDPDYGRNIFEYLHKATTPEDFAAMGGELEGEIAKDDRVDDQTVVVTSSAPGTLDVSIAIT